MSTFSIVFKSDPINKISWGGGDKMTLVKSENFKLSMYT